MPKKKLVAFDQWFFGMACVLLGLGLVVLYSASTVESFKDFDTTTYYFFHQLTYGALLGVIGMYVCSRIDYHLWQKLIPIGIVAALILLVLVKVPGIGFGANGATRWIHFGPIVFQPGELAKLVIIMYTAGFLAKRQHALHDFTYGVLPALVITMLFAALILWQPDVGTMLVLILTVLTMLFVAGIHLKYFAAIIAAGTSVLFLLIKFEPYRARRLVTFLNPSFDPLGISYQINQALLAIGAGGIWGYGYGLSRQKHNYLPEAIGDSIFAVTAEELGLLRVLLILSLFLAFIMRGIKIAMAAPDSFGKMLGIGMISAIAIQVIINIGAIVGLLPLTGIPLPFFSYGSSALIIILCEVGILLNISRQSR